MRAERFEGRIFGLLLLGIVLASLQGVTSGAGNPEMILLEAAALAGEELPPRSPVDSRLLRGQANAAHYFFVNLTPEFSAARDPEISFAGTRVLFSGQKTAGMPWQEPGQKTAGMPWQEPRA